MNIKPLGNKILVQKVEAPEPKLRSLLLVSSSKPKLNLAEIVAIGEGFADIKEDKIPAEIQPGAVVLLTRYCGEEITIDGEDYVMVNLADITGIATEF